ncbi:MAG TPA: hypothetical protein VGM94_01015 [Galbitalea sp.]|jgi:hypothetical protein
MASTAISTTDVSTAQQQLNGMKRALAQWLRVRAINDSVMSGTITKIRKPLGYAQRVIANARNLANEQDLADKLNALLTELMPGVVLPNPNLSVNPNGAVQLAQTALSGKVPMTAMQTDMSVQPTADQSALSGVGATHPWLWPVLIVGGLLIGITTAIKTAADVAKDQEQTACIEAGACTDYGFWLKAGGIVVISWFAWKEMGIGDMVKGALKRRS